MLREILDKTVERVGKDLANQPEAEAELRTTIGYTYAELGDLPAAEGMAREALRLRRALFGDTNELVAASLSDLAAALAERRQGRAEAEKLQREALAIRRRLFGNEHAEVATSLYRLGVVVEDRNLADAEALYREALAIQRKVFHNDHPD